jgi:HK97 family phage prohead protease
VVEDKVIRAAAWAARHRVDLDASANSDSGDDDWPGPGAVAHYLWGVDPLDPNPATDWFTRKSQQIQDERKVTPMMEPPATLTDLVRHVEFRAVDTATRDGLTLDGYAAVFNDWTVIEGPDGPFRERIIPGAFAKTIAERTPILQFDHGTHPVIGSIPLGVVTALEEDEHGLRVRARLADNWLVAPVRDAIANGSIDGMSFKFRVVQQDWERADDRMFERSITEIALYEVGPVVWPAYESTSVGVRSAEIAAALIDPTVRQEVARLLTSGTPEGAAESPTRSEPQPHSEQGTPEGAAESPTPPEPQKHSGRTRNQRQALIQEQGVQ